MRRVQHVKAQGISISVSRNQPTSVAGLRSSVNCSSQATKVKRTSLIGTQYEALVETFLKRTETYQEKSGLDLGAAPAGRVLCGRGISNIVHPSK